MKRKREKSKAFEFELLQEVGSIPLMSEEAVRTLFRQQAKAVAATAISMQQQRELAPEFFAWATQRNSLAMLELKMDRRRNRICGVSAVFLSKKLTEFVISTIGDKQSGDVVCWSMEFENAAGRTRYGGLWFEKRSDPMQWKLRGAETKAAPVEYPAIDRSAVLEARSPQTAKWLDRD